jgi:hypothetical protein
MKYWEDYVDVSEAVSHARRVGVAKLLGAGGWPLNGLAFEDNLR